MGSSTDTEVWLTRVRSSFPHRLVADHAAALAYDEIAVWLSLPSAFCWLGWNKALDAAGYPDRVMRERKQQEMNGWIQQARLTLNAGLL